MFAHLLVSPDDGTSLNFEYDKDGVLISCSTSSRIFKVYNGIPILLPLAFNHSDNGDVLSLVSRRRHPLYILISRLLNGSNHIAAANLKTFLKLLLEKKDGKKLKILVVGGGNIGEGSELLYEEANIDLISFDIYRTENVQFVADAHHIPLTNNSIDGVWIQAVLEHVVIPEKVVSEIHRVLHENGMVYSETPFMQQVHEGRFDFQRFSESGHRWLFRHFDIIDTGVVWGPGRSLQWSIRYFFWGLTRSRFLAIALSTPFIFIRWFDRVIPRNLSSDGASNLFLMGKKSTYPISVDELFDFYQGSQ